MDGKYLIPKIRFQKVVREIAGDYTYFDDGLSKNFRWEIDALVALQMMTEHLLIMMFEMTFVSS
jgi:histone H3/H4